MFSFIPFIALILLALFLYMSYFFRRIFRLLFTAKGKRYPKWIPYLIAVPAVVPAMRVWDLWAVVLLHIVAISLFLDLIRFITRRVSRREWPRCKRIYLSGLIPVVLTLLVMVYGYFNMQPVFHTEYTVATDKDIRPEGYHVLFLSDLHFGTTMNQQDLQERCDEMNALKPDLVILGGDIVDESTTLEQMQDTFRILGGIDSTYGTFYVYGNHDRATYSATASFNAGQLEAAISQNGIEILQDSTLEINDELSISGREDRSVIRGGGERFPAADLLLDSAADAFHILADHQPRDIAESAAAGFDLMVSGHTHAGQIWPTGLFNVLGSDTMNYGHEVMNGMDVVVTSGIAGWGYAIRTSEHCEYVSVYIKQAD